MINGRKTIIRFWILVILTAELDQVTKIAVVHSLTEGEVIPIIPYCLNLILTYNKGIAFGMMAGFPDFWRQVIINGATLIALLMILYFLRRQYKDDFIAHMAMALIVGGAVGNIIDRFFLGQVVDFIDAYISSYHWPAFNVADSAVCIGVFVLLFKPVRKESETDTARED